MAWGEQARAGKWMELWKGRFGAAAGRSCSAWTPVTGRVQTLKGASLEAVFSSHIFPHPTSNKTQHNKFPNNWFPSHLSLLNSPSPSMAGVQ